jgi:hypothetical protein
MIDKASFDKCKIYRRIVCQKPTVRGRVLLRSKRE